jgi:hypothetical protein
MSVTYDNEMVLIGETSECGCRSPDYFGENRPFDAARVEVWRSHFLRGEKSVTNSEWLKEHLGRQLLGAGMHNHDAREVAEMLRDDIRGLLLARDAARGHLSQLGYLEDLDVPFKNSAQRSLEAVQPEIGE